MFLYEFSSNPAGNIFPVKNESRRGGVSVQLEMNSENSFSPLPDPPEV